MCGNQTSVYLHYLKDEAIEVLWRHLHEMNQDSFWWARVSPNGTAEFYRLTHDGVVNPKGINSWFLIRDAPSAVNEMDGHRCHGLKTRCRRFRDGRYAKSACSPANSAE
jgi:hypothetical protein